jgi:dTDP-4-dehydrorhamnose reductase
LLYRKDGLNSLATIGGIYHMTAAGETSWFEFAKAILDEASSAAQTIPWIKSASNGMPFITERIIPITTAEYPTPASRPAYSVLSTARLRDCFGVSLPPWRAQLQSLFAPSASEGQPAL